MATLLLVLCIGLVMGFISTTGEKTQSIRVIDVLLYGPVLIAASAYVDPLWLRAVLVFMGASTITYNLRNYFAEQKIQRMQKGV